METGRRRRLSSFNSVQEVLDWLLSHGTTYPRQELERMFKAREWRLSKNLQRHELDYQLVIHGRKGTKPFVQIHKQLRRR
jgi:hypothetical protein